jgi:uncharacterized membrane protein (TIGR02234 family)
MSRRREYLLVLAVGAVGAGLLLFAAGRPWAHGVVTGTPGRLEINPSGRKVAPVAAGLGLFALAGVVAVVATRKVERAVVAALLCLAGLGVLADVIRVAVDPGGALHRAAVEAAGLTQPTVYGAGLTGWPVMAALGAVLVLGAGAATLTRGQRWPVMSARYERQPGGAGTAGGLEGAGRPEHAADSATSQRAMWDAIDRGEDPTS